MRQTNVKQWCFLVILMVLGWSSPSLAHKVYVFAWAEDGFVHSESSFGDKKVIKGKVEVTDDSGAVISKGITDEQGNYSFKIPENPGSDLFITMDASMGHMATWRVPLEEMQGATSKTAHGDAMAQKAELEKGPSVMRIVSGIGIIFALAFGAGVVNNRRRKSHHD
jgi:nickel transport protein